MLSANILTAAVLGALVGWFLANNSKPKDHPVVEAVRKLISDQKKKAKEIDLSEELKKLMEGK